MDEDLDYTTLWTKETLSLSCVIEGQHIILLKRAISILVVHRGLMSFFKSQKLHSHIEAVFERLYR